MEHEASRNGKVRGSRWVHAFLGAGLAAGVVLPAMTGPVEARCLTVQTPWQVRMPDGAVYEPGLLRICHRGGFSPVRTIEDVAIGGRAAGRWIARTSSSEDSRADGAVAYFERTESGVMGLLGYSVPDAGGGSTTVLLTRPSEQAVAAARPKVGTPSKPRVVLAARVH